MKNNPNAGNCTNARDSGTDGNSYAALRQQFRLFVNDDTRFRKFLEFCNVKARQSGRLSFWQEKLWRAFVMHNPDAAAIDFAALLEAFHVCHIHMLPLHSVEVPIRKGVWCIYRSPEIDARFNREARFSESFCLDSPSLGNATHFTVEHCDECHAARKRIEGE